MAEGYMIAPGQTAQELDYKRRLAYALMKEGADASPVQHWTQGLARLGQGALGGYEMYAAEKADKEETARGNELMAKFLMQGQGQGQGGQPAAPANPAMAPPMGQNVGAMLAAGPVTPPVAGARPEVMPSPKVWGDKEAEAAGLYDPPAKPVQMAQASPQAALPPPAPVPAQTANGGTVAPGTTLQPGLNREALIAMLGNRKTNPMAQAIIQGQIAQQFKPTEYDFKERPDGSFVAINKKNPQDTRIIQPGNAQDLIKFAADKEGATTQAKQNVERSGAVEFEANKAGAIEKSKLQAAKDIAKPEQDKQAKQVANIVTDDIDRAIAKVDGGFLPTTGAAGAVLSQVGGTGANDIRALVDTVKANSGFQELSKMRQASPTGAALGSVTERELSLLQATTGNLEQSQTAAQFKDNLRRLKNVHLDIIHGEGNGPPREKLTFKEKPKDEGWQTLPGGVRIREKR